MEFEGLAAQAARLHLSPRMRHVMSGILVKGITAGIGRSETLQFANECMAVQKSEEPMETKMQKYLDLLTKVHTVPETPLPPEQYIEDHTRAAQALAPPKPADEEEDI
ncbi:unnamed protein product [Dicrocoelium dendriticum]|nr:unnamed protein product [Dicrocoelium dendriticum]